MLEKIKGNRLRIFYAMCFVALCVVNNAVGSQPGRVQFVAVNLSGLVVATIIFSAYRFKDFLKPAYYVWAAVSVVGGVCAILWGAHNYPYWGRWCTAVLNVAVYGFIIIRLVIKFFAEKQVKPIRLISLSLWTLMIILMVVSPHESVWPLWYGVMFLSLYLSDFDVFHTKALLNGLMDGIIVGFVLIQGAAFAFRPYDLFRYHGFFTNPNMTALFYIVVYAVFVTKWCLSTQQCKKILEQSIWAVLSCAMFGFVFLTGSKAALAAMAVITIVFLISVVCLSKKKIVSFIKYCLIIGVLAIASIPVTYVLVRYLPTVHLHPIYFEGEYSESKVLPGESWDSEKYISFSTFMHVNLGRFLWFIDFDEEESTAEMGANDKENNIEEKERINDEYLFNDADSLNPIEERLAIYGYYFKHLNLFGHSSSKDGVPITPYYTIPHAHNWILQMSFSYGIIAGILLLYMTVQYMILVIRAFITKNYGFACLVGSIIATFFVFGFFEVSWAVGQIQFLLFFMLYYFVISGDSLAATTIVGSAALGERC